MELTSFIFTPVSIFEENLKYWPTVCGATHARRIVYNFHILCSCALRDNLGINYAFDLILFFCFLDLCYLNIQALSHLHFPARCCSLFRSLLIFPSDHYLHSHDHLMWRHQFPMDAQRLHRCFSGSSVFSCFTFFSALFQWFFLPKGIPIIDNGQLTGVNNNPLHASLPQRHRERKDAWM